MLLRRAPASFEQVKAIWESELWAGRKSPIEPTSAMKWLGGIDMSLMQAAPSFWVVLEESESQSPGRIVGTLSGHFGGTIQLESNSLRSFRTRGLWVNSLFRKRGIARLLMSAASEQAEQEDCDVLWTFPRQSSMPAYERLGFQKFGEWIGSNDPGAGEFGPNCYALFDLRPINIRR